MTIRSTNVLRSTRPIIIYKERRRLSGPVSSNSSPKKDSIVHGKVKSLIQKLKEVRSSIQKESVSLDLAEDIGKMQR